MVALVTGEAEDALLQDGIVPVPEGEREAQHLPVVAHAAQAFLAPAVGTAASVVVRHVVPRRAVLAVVLPHGAPSPLAQVRPPSLPARVHLVEAPLLCIHPHRSTPRQCPLEGAPAR